MGERVAIVGSRDWNEPRVMYQQVVEYIQALPDDTTIVTGGARGVDRWAEQAAKARGLKVEVIRPDWRHGIQAGVMRNTTIVERSDRVVAFWNGESGGTRDTIRKAKSRGRPFEVVEPEFVLT